jgi:hypothetical protein
MKSERVYIWSGFITMLLSGLVHLYRVPTLYAQDRFVGILFFVFFLASLVAAIGIYRSSLVSGWLQNGTSYIKGSFFWGWALGWLLAVLTILGYLLSWALGWPVAYVGQWGAAGVIAVLAIQAVFLFLFARWHPVTMLVSRKHASNHSPVA